ncbi:MAG TPA: LysM peptidoglycan-binding domain-containing protein [Pararhizobium sp.]|nr:LysM peptidoglycan-binding domain-containing protein [Pararhizobium sp.]
MAAVAAVAVAFVASPASAAGCGGRVQTGYGTNALALAQRCGVTLQELQRANPMIDTSRPLTNGEIVRVPNLHPQYIPDSVARGAPPASSVLPPVPHSHPAIRPRIGAERQPTGNGVQPYTIRPGDTLSGIAARADVPLDRLMAANPGVNPRRLAVGQTIAVPAVD